LGKNYFMGLSFSKVKTDKELRATTSLSIVKFNTLSVLFSNTYSKIYGVSIEESQKNLVKDFAFSSSSELLFFVLFGLKNPIVLTVLGLIFEIPQSTANYNLSKGGVPPRLRILHQCLIENDYMPVRDFKDEEEFLAYFQSEGKIVLDVTEFKIGRPSENTKQKEVYSGKKTHIVGKL
jgi:hypothetical protein